MTQVQIDLKGQSSHLEIDKGPVSDGPWAKSGPPFVLYAKYWDTAMPICLQITYNPFLAKIAVSSCDADHMACQAYDIYYLALHRKNPPTSGVNRPRGLRD